MNIFIITVQIVCLIVSGIALWQIWSFLKKKDIPEDEPLGEARVKYLTDRLNVLQVCLYIEIAAIVIRFVLQIMETIRG